MSPSPGSPTSLAVCTPRQLHRHVGLAFVGDGDELCIAGALGSLGDECQGDVALGREQVQVVEVAEQAQRTGSWPVEQAAEQTLAFVVGVAAVTLERRRQ